MPVSTIAINFMQEEWPKAIGADAFKSTLYVFLGFC